VATTVTAATPGTAVATAGPGSATMSVPSSAVVEPIPMVVNTAIPDAPIVFIAPAAANIDTPIAGSISIRIIRNVIFAIGLRRPVSGSNSAATDDYCKDNNQT